jgi:cytochrome c peroxidase
MKLDSSKRPALMVGLALTALAACDDGRGARGGATLTGDDTTTLAAMALVPASLPASPTNAHADDAAAAALGRALFFDAQMSADGTIACASCHDPARGFSDPRPVSLGVSGRPGARHSMPATAVPLHPFLFWDGRADSVWSQPLKAIEGSKEMDFTRVEVTRFLAARHATAYEAVFGALPDTAGLPARAAPGMPAWDGLSAAQQDQVNRAFSNAGKAIEAYERKLLCADTRFDRFVRGEITLTATESAGAADFVQSGCTRCHNGPSFSDGKFHDLGIGNGSDPGRAGGLAKLLADPFNGAGVYSDDTVAGEARLAATALETRTQGAFRTASLRGAGQRTAFGHLGDRATLQEFIREVYDRGRGGGGRNGGGGGLDPLLDGVDPGNVDDIVAFLHTLDCPAPPAELLAP